MTLAGNGQGRIKAALIVCISDLFLGSAAIIVVVLVMANNPIEPKVRMVVNSLIECRTDSSNSLFVRGVPFEEGTTDKPLLDQNSNKFLPFSLWLEQINNDTFIGQYGVLVSPNNSSCLSKLRGTIIEYNRTLQTRGKIRPAISIIEIPLKTFLSTKKKLK